MADAHISGQTQHVTGMKHIAHQAVAFAQMQLTFVGGHDTGGVLPAMLQHRQPVINRLVDTVFTYDSDDAAHVVQPRLLCCCNRRAF